MSKQRFRDVKKGIIKQNSNETKSLKNVPDYASARLKLKAFLTDSFMLTMPIMYMVFYLLMDGREAFAANRLQGWIAILVPLITIQTLFMFYSAQTPGYKAYNIKVINEHTCKNLSFLSILFRNICAVLSFFTIIGWVMMFFRKDAKTLHDLLSKTAVVTVDAKKS